MSCLACGLERAFCCANIKIPLTPDEAVYFGLPNQIMPLRQNGACVMLVEDRCSIYETRPQACRDQDPGVCFRGMRP